MKKALVSVLFLFAFSFSFSQTFSLTDSKVKVGSYYRDYRMNFAHKALHPDCYPLMDSVVNFMKTNRFVKLEIGVHTDYRGSAEANNKLSQFYAKIILDHLLLKGIDSSRLEAVGYGEKRPLKVYSGDTLLYTLTEIYINKFATGKSKEEYEALMRKNRRVEFKILTNKPTFSLTDTNIVSYGYHRTYNILFDLGKATLRQESFSHLDSVVAFLNNNPKIKLEIGVHSDSRGPQTSGSHLTMNRASAISNYLISKGISIDRLYAKGYSCVRPLITDVQISKLKTKEEIEDAHHKNRRVEFTILAI